MIYTVTLNPCVDKTAVLKYFNINSTNRVVRYEKNIRGKGINTSVVLKNLDVASTVFTFDFSHGPSVSAFLDEQKIPHITIKLDGEIRENIKIFDSRKSETTELNEKGSFVNPKQLKQFFSIIKHSITNNDIIIVSGSAPDGVPDDFYKQLIEFAKDKGCKTILDADGELLKKGIEAKPNLVKLNLAELSVLSDTLVSDIDDAVKYAEILIRQGIDKVCVSMGGKGSVYLSKNEVFTSAAETHVVNGTVGAGDSMVAGFALAMEKGWSDHQALKVATALAAGTVSLPSGNLCTKELFESMIEKIIVKKM